MFICYWKLMYWNIVRLNFNGFNGCNGSWIRLIDPHGLKVSLRGFIIFLLMEGPIGWFLKLEGSCRFDFYLYKQTVGY